MMGLNKRAKPENPQKFFAVTRSGYLTRCMESSLCSRRLALFYPLAIQPITTCTI